VLTLVAGTCLLMWIGELITQRGIGNGMSILIFASVVSTLPFQYYAILKEKKFVVFAILVLISIGILVAVVFIEQGQRRIPVQFAKRVVGRRQYGGQSTYIPLKVNQAGVIPIIFASSILLLPALLTNIFNYDWLQSFVDTYVLNSQNWLHIMVYALLIVGFSYFYNAIAFDPVKQADQIRKQGGFIPGIRPGPQTERYPPAHPEPDHPARRPLHRLDRHPSEHRAGHRQRATVPLRRHHRAHRRRRRPRDHEADRQPADAAQLRGLPEVTATFRQCRREEDV